MKNDITPTGLRITETLEGVLFSIHVQPRASRNEMCGIQGGELKVRLTSPPVEDAANKLCIEYFAKLLSVAKSRVSITAGAKSRHKTIKVAGIDGAAVLSLIKDR
jgi:uncharacterized protein (TIGR00251 family)